MAPSAASLIFVIGIAGLFLLDRERENGTSPALWLAIFWVGIGASRMASEWLAGSANAQSAEQYLEGSPMDRNLLTGVLIAAVGVLAARGEKTTKVLAANWPLVLFFLYAALSSLWSDFPDVTFKRWTKAFGNLAMVLVVLTDPQPTLAIRRLLTWTGFLLIPLSVLFIKYYPDIGRGYDRWLGTAYYHGVTTEKNSLGRDLLVFGLGSVWVLTAARASRQDRLRRVTAHATMLAMVAWLFYMADSATSLTCFTLGTVLILLLARGKDGGVARVHLLVAGMISAALLVQVFDLKAHFFEALGRDPTLTGRTELWDDLFPLVTSPLFGTGFESFFLGSRLDVLWAKYWWRPNEAHNGYLEIYLTLGWIGLGLLAMVIVKGYFNAVAEYGRNRSMGSLKIAMLISCLVYNFTEAGFKVMTPVWIAFILAVTAMPEAETVPVVSKVEPPARSAAPPRFRSRLHPDPELTPCR